MQRPFPRNPPPSRSPKLALAERDEASHSAVLGLVLPVFQPLTDWVRIATAIRDAHFTEPWRQLPDFMDPAHKIEMVLLPGPNGAMVQLYLDGECKGLFSIGEKFEVEFLGVPTDYKPIVVGPKADILPFRAQ